MASCSSWIASAILGSVTRINPLNRAHVLIGWQLTTHVCQALTRQKWVYQTWKRLVKKLARIEASFICRQQFADMFADCICAVHTHQLEFANFSLPSEGCLRLNCTTHFLIFTFLSGVSSFMSSKILIKEAELISNNFERHRLASKNECRTSLQITLIMVSW